MDFGLRSLRRASTGTTLANWRRTRIAVAVLLALILSSQSHAQLLGVTGANHPELDWNQIETRHFTLVYHQGLDSIARVAAPIAEEVYRVVTTNLETPLNKKIRIYFSDNDEERNAFAFSDNYIFIWMRGILDDNLFSLRASGTSKWLRSVLTHEFTHIVIAHATHTWFDDILPLGGVPRWFNEGMARYMEPDGWTNDLDIPLRVGAVSSKLNLGGEDLLAGTFMYEGGQSLVRYIASKYGDSTLVKIIKHREGGISAYNFEEAIKETTKHPFRELYDDWHKTLNVYYNTEYGQKEDVEDIARKIPTGLAVVGAARLSPDEKDIALLGKKTIEEGSKLFIVANDTGSHIELVIDEPGIEPYLSWSPDGKYLLFSKVRFGSSASLVYDLYKCDVSTGELTRLSTDARLEYPDWSPDGKQIVAAQFSQSGSDLVVLDAEGLHLSRLTNFNEGNVEVYAPRWSPDGKQVAFSIFRKNGMRDVATVDVASGAVRYFTNDSINDRYPVWSPRGDSVLFLSFQDGLPNLYAMPAVADGTPDKRRALTNVASNILAWDWSKHTDSILVTSFESRNSVQMYWLPATRNATSTPMPALAPKYTEWRNIHWPLVTRTQDSIPATEITGPLSYNSLAHIHSLAILPLVGTDLTRSGDPGVQWGAVSIFSDEMQKHLIEAFGFYGDVSHSFTYGVQYQNNQLRPTISAGASHIIGFKDVLDDVAYYEHSHSYNLGVSYIFHTPNSLTNIHSLSIGGEYTDREPWNLSAFDSIQVSHRPIAAKLATLSITYAYLSKLLQSGIGVTHFDHKLGSDLTRTRFRAFVHWELPMGEDDHDQLAFIAHGAADFGDELPQDHLGFYNYDVFEGGFDFTTVHPRDRLRGIRRASYGNRLVLGSVELRQRDQFFSNLVPIIKAFEPQLVEFFDMGSAWYANAPGNNQAVPVISTGSTEWLKSIGIELRSEVGFDLSLGAGVGWEMLHAGFHSSDYGPPDWFLRLNAEL